MKKVLLFLSFLGLFLGYSPTASATHLAGGEITYENIGGDTFVVTVTLYRDCSGITMPTYTRNVRITSSCTTPQTLVVALQGGGGEEVSQICPSQISLSQCNGGTLPGMQKFTYQGQIVLGTHCSDYLIQFQEANRNPSINVTNSNSTRFYVDAALNSTLYPNNSSPIYTAPPIPYVCLNQTVNYNYGIVENDGDSLSFALVSARRSNAAMTFVVNSTYNAGYTGTAPIIGVTIDSSTGQLSFTPGAPVGNYIVVTQVTEYNGAGQVVSTVERDIQFVVINCSNQIPSNPTSVSVPVNTVGSATRTDSLEITANVGDEFCFDVSFSDINANDTIAIVTNAASALPGSTVSFAGINPATATICWTVPPGMNTNNTVTFQASDSACPVSGVNSLAVTVIVPPPSSLSAVITTTGISCFGLCDGTATAVASGGVGPYDFFWDPIGGGCCQGLPSVTGLCQGGGILIVQDLGDPDPSTNTIILGYNIDPAPVFGALVRTITDDDCSATCVGAVSVLSYGGTVPRTYLWNSGQTTEDLTGVCAGMYTLTVTDANGCTQVVSAEVQEPTPPTILIDSTDSVTCFGGSDGVVYARAHPTCGVSTDACATPVSVQLGTGVSTNGFNTYPAPYGNSSFGAKHQMLFTAAELTAAGVLPGTISSLAFNIATLGSTINYANFNIKMGCSSATDLTGGWETGLTEVLASTTHSATAGWNTHDFDVKYFWDGLSNIVVEVCFNNPNSTAVGNAQTNYTATTNQSVRYYTADNTSVCGSNGLTATSTNRPNVRFGNCASSFTYAWSPAPAAGQVTPTASNLTAQTYTLTVTSVGDGCTETITATVDQPDLIVPTITITNDISCPGICDASISIASIGGEGPYTYVWDNGLPPNETHTNLCAGTYNVTVTDAKLCTVTSSVTITDPPVITASTTINTPISCNGVCDGDVTVVAGGGTAPFTIAWPGGLVGANQTNLCTGIYQVTITDASNCFITHDVILPEPATLTVSLATVGTVLCNGDNSVTINSTVLGGTINYSYLWSNGQSTPNLTNVGAGTYSLTVTDAHNCTATDQVIITEPTPLVGAINQTVFIQCNGDLTASLTASASGGTAGYTYAWDNGINTPVNANIGAGNYTVTITDANNCTDIQTITVTEPTQVVANLTIDTPISCNGVCDGVVSVAPSGGTAPYTVLWQAGMTAAGNTATNLCGNTAYDVTITDANNCQLIVPINLTEPTQVVVVVTETTSISCGGTCDGVLSAGVSGGTAPYTYLWSTGATTSSINNLCAGNFSVTVTDANLCAVNTTYILTEPSPIVVTINLSGVNNCFGDTDVDLLANAVGGTAPYTYAWSNGINNASNPSLGADSYTVTVTDANNCTQTATQLVTEPTLLVVTNTVNSTITCNGVCDGSVTVSASGGTPGYTYAWPGGLTGATQTTLCAGSYIVTATDANNCTETVSFTLTEPAAIVANQTLVSGVMCNGVCDGSVTYLPTGGTAPYTITWPAGVTNANDTATALCANTTYTVTVTDANNCTVTDAINLTEPTPVAGTINLDQGVSCGGICDAQVTASGSGGTGPYTYAWPGGINGATNSNLCAGTYEVTVTDANNCTGTESITITEPNPVLTTISQAGTILCFGDSTVDLTAASNGGTAPYNYVWNTGATTAVITNTGAGAYSVTTTDANLCSIVTTFTVTEPADITLSANITPMSCGGGACDGAATIIAVGGTPGMTFAWPGGLNGPTQNSLCAGDYVVTVTDANACSDTITVSIVNPQSIVIITNVTSHVSCNGVCDGEAEITLTGGTAPLTIAWPSGGTGTTESNLCAGTHIVTVTDANSCSSTATIVINDASILDLTLIETSPITCNGVCDGVVSSTISGGTAPFTVIWPGNDTTDVKTGLCIGTYTVTVVDANACSTTEDITISEPAVIAASITITTAISCNSECDGVLTATITGGTAPYVVTWNDGTVGMSLNNACAGNYSYNVVDANGCTSTASISLTEPAEITTNLDVRDAICGICNGRIVANGTTGGDGGPYTYNWSGGFSPPPFPNRVVFLCAGTYTVTITDGSGCSVVLTQNISNRGGPNTPVFVTTNPTCPGGTDGSSTVSASGGTAPYTYAWSSGSVTDTQLGIGAGVYTVTVTDVNGCELVASDTLIDPASITNTPTITNASCNNDCDGSITLVSAGGLAPYTYVWDNAMTGNSVSSLCDGTYIVTTTDANNCSIIDTFEITEPTVINVSIAISGAISCYGSCDGEMTATVTGGTAPYTMSWSNGGAGNIAVGLCAGSHEVTVTDANGCVQTASLAITEPAEITTNVASVDATCGACDGTITLSGTAGGDGGPYTYAWSNGESSQAIIGLCAGTYDVTITDGNGCVSTISVPISNTGGPTAAPITLTNPSCNAVCDGTMQVVPTGGTMPYTYSWSSGGNTDSEIGLCAGIYFVTVTDANGCVFIGTDTIVEPTLIMNTETIVDLSCNAICNGSISLVTIGGTSPYSYSWSDGSTGSSLNSLCAGSYTVTTTDASNCSTIDTYIVGEPAPISLSIVVATPISCNGECDGELTAGVTGGTAPYTFSWSDGSVTSSIFNLCANTYSVTITDANGCVEDTSIVLNEPSEITATITPTNATCGVADGEATITNINGGDGGPYTLLWSTGSGATTITNLLPGNYTVTVTDGNGCAAILSTSVSNNGGPTAATFVNRDPSCNGLCDGMSRVTPIGGTAPFTYAWSSGSTVDSTDMACDGVYLVTITDASGCILIVTDTLTEPTLITNTETIANASCNGVCDGTISLVTTGGAGTYTYSWSNGGSGLSISGLCVGSYTVTTTDANNCSITNTYNVTEPTGMTLAITSTDANCFNVCDGSAMATATGGTAPYIYVWSNGTLGDNAMNLCSGSSYDVTVTDANGCSTSSSVTISGPPAIVINSITVVNAACGMANGSANAVATGGTGPLTYTWNGTPGNPLTNATAGTYVLEVSDANGCSITVNVPINNDLGPVLTVSGTDITCFGDRNGTATATVTGTSTYTYLWNTGSTNDVITGLSGGAYFVEVTDVTTGCVSTDTITISEPTQITIDNVITQSPTCGSSNGGALAFASGGTGALTYSWNGVQVNPLIAAPAGSYTLLVTDASGCTAQTVVPLSDSGQFVATATGTDVNCFGDLTGTASVTVNPAGTYTYQWTSSAGDISANVTGLAAGTYGVSVTDPNTGCSAADTVTIGSPTQITIDNVNMVRPGCGASDGSLEAFVSGGTPGYTYLWDGTTPGNPLTNISAGTYNLEVTDQAGCIATIIVPLSDTGSLTASFATTNVPCDGSCVGTATATPNGGSGTYTYLWSNGDATATATNLCVGVASVTITDVNGGCTVVDTVSVNQDNGLNLTMSSTDNTNCNGTCDGTADVVVSGNTGTLTYAWSNGDATSTISNLCAGTFVVTVTDASGCSSIDSVIITDIPTMVLTIDSVFQTTCLNTNDGQIDITVVGGVTPYTYSWTGPGGFTSNSQNISFLTTGQYIVEVTSPNGCTVTDTAVVTSSSSLSVSLADQVDCSGADSVTLTPVVIGTTDPITYQWYNLSGSVIGNDSNLTVVMPTDTTYYVVGVVAGGCTATDTAFVAPGQIPDVDAGISQSIVLGQEVKLGGSPTTTWGGSTFNWTPDSYLSNNEVANPIASPTETTLYTVEVTNILGCKNSDTVLIIVTKKLPILSGFTPNGDGVNDTWELDFLDKYPSVQVDVYNRWGELLFHSDVGYPVPWDGKFEGVDAPVGTYYYVIDLKDGDFPDPISGPITIIR